MSMPKPNAAKVLDRLRDRSMPYEHVLDIDLFQKRRTGMQP